MRFFYFSHTGMNIWKTSPTAIYKFGSISSIYQPKILGNAHTLTVAYDELLKLMLHMNKSPKSAIKPKHFVNINNALF